MKSLKLAVTLGAIGFCLAAGVASAQTKLELNAAQAAEQKRAEVEMAAAKQAQFEAALPERMALVDSVINQYAQELVGDGSNDGARLSHFAVFVHSTPSAVLEVARTARSAAEFAGYAEKVVSDLGAVDSKAALGDGVNLVFVPIGPCRFADSRTSTAGALPTGVIRQYQNFSNTGQGGTTGCNQGTGPGITSGTPGAIAMNLTVTGATAQGFVAARPSGSTNVTSAINFVANQDLANAIVIKMTGTTPNDFEVLPQLNAPGATVHVILDLLGFYVASEPAALDCLNTATTAGTTGTNPALETSATAPACAAGYTRVSMDCQESNDALLVDMDVSGNFCAYVPRAAVASGFTVGARCCRVAGNTAGRF